MNATAIVGTAAALTMTRKRVAASSNNTRICAAKKAKGIAHDLPWGVMHRKEKETIVDEDGDCDRLVVISRQRALLKAGASVASKTAGDVKSFGGSTTVKDALEKNAADARSWTRCRSRTASRATRPRTRPNPWKVCDGVPQFIKLRLDRWKHNHKGKLTQDLLIQRNDANPKFCPIVTMLKWLNTLRENGITNGPLFPALNNAHNDFLRTEVDGVMHLQKMTANTFSRHTRLLCIYAGGEFKECSHHSFRRAFVKWGARRGASEHDIKSAGRWKGTSTRFAQYWGNGQTKMEEMLLMKAQNPNFVDPIYAVWRWQPIAREGCETSGRAR